MKLAVIRLKGGRGINPANRMTLELLNLKRVNHCVVFEQTPSRAGMVRKVNSYITWGEVNNETLALLQQKRGADGKNVFRLHPPRKGLGRRGIKSSFKQRGALGYRGAAINELIKKMI